MAQEHEIISPHVVGSALVLDTKVPVQQTQKLCHMVKKRSITGFVSSGFVCLILSQFLRVWSKWMKPISRIFRHHGKANWQQKIAHQVLLKNSVDKNDTTRFCFSIFNHKQDCRRMAAVYTGRLNVHSGDSSYRYSCAI